MGRHRIIDEDWAPPMSDRPIATRLPTWLDDRLRWQFRHRGEGPSVGLRRVVEEWWTHETFPVLEFRDGPRGRQASIAGGPEVWQIVAIWRSSGESAWLIERTFPAVTERLLEQVLEYAILFAEPIEAAIQRHGGTGVGALT